MGYTDSRPLAVVTGASSGMENKDDPRDVAREGFNALMDGRDLVVAGSAKNKAQAAAGKIMPETAAAKMHGRISEPGSAT